MRSPFLALLKSYLMTAVVGMALSTVMLLGYSTIRYAPAPVSSIAYAVFITFFCYFYTAIVFNPDATAEDMRKYGGFIPGLPRSFPSRVLRSVIAWWSEPQVDPKSVARDRTHPSASLARGAH